MSREAIKHLLEEYKRGNDVALEELIAVAKPSIETAMMTKITKDKRCRLDDFDDIMSHLWIGVCLYAHKCEYDFVRWVVNTLGNWAIAGYRKELRKERVVMNYDHPEDLEWYGDIEPSVDVWHNSPEELSILKEETDKTIHKLTWDFTEEEEAVLWWDRVAQLTNKEIQTIMGYADEREPYRVKQRIQYKLDRNKERVNENDYRG